MLLFNKEYLKEKNASHIDEIFIFYNSAFGFSFQDGIRPMADIITTQITGNTNVFYDAFYVILDELFNDIKRIKLISSKPAKSLHMVFLRSAPIFRRTLL